MISERYRHNSGALFSLKYHMVWCPKYRCPVLTDDIAERLRTLLQEKAEELKATILSLEILPDHVHMFLESDPTKAPAQLAAQFKGYSSHVLRSEFKTLRSRLPTLWSRSYYIGSVGTVSDEVIRKYIESQRTRK